MFFKDLNKTLIIAALSAGCMIAASSCSLIKEDLAECPAGLSVRFKYDYNLSFADAFRHEVKSVNVWTFDHATGALVWSAAVSGDQLKNEDFEIATPLPAGCYDFVSWCGLKDNDDFDIATYTPSSKEELEVTLKTIEAEGLNESRSHFAALFNGTLLEQTYVVKDNEPSLKTVTVPLMKDTKDIRVLLQRYNGEPLGSDDFDVNITIADSHLAWDNEVLASPDVTYGWWGKRYGQITVNDAQRAENIISGIVYELSSSRLMAEDKATLTVTRNSDGKVIIEVPIVEYFLMVQGHYFNEDGSPLSDQEYLDRQDDYSIIFFIDENNGWYMGAGIYINSWAVVPPQSEGV